MAQQIAGYHTVTPLQCPEISSSSDKTCLPILDYNYLRVHCRASYRVLRSNRMPIPLPEPHPANPVENPVPIAENKNGPRNLSTGFAITCVALLFVISVFTLFLVYTNFPDLTEDERQHIKIPWNMDEAKKLGIVLERFKEDHFYQVLTGVFVTYIFLQTFAIPGSLFLSILSGFLFPFVLALILVCTCSAVGASLCFLLSQLLGRRLVLKYFPARAASWAVIVDKHRDNLLNYVIFLRITPFLPNWFINLTAPVIGVPLVPFAVGTFLGVAPPSFVAIQGGQTLYTMSADDTAFSWISVVLLIIFAVVSLIPIFLKERLKKKFD